MKISIQRVKTRDFTDFKQLNLNCNFHDNSLVKEKVAYDLLRDFGVSAPEASFCLIYIDYGDGPVSYGIYTIVEEVDDTLIKTQFTKGGNLYKPEGNGATFASGSYNEDDLNKKTNKKDSDFPMLKSFIMY